jgi:hypothetical protein
MSEACPYLMVYLSWKSEASSRGVLISPYSYILPNIFFSWLEYFFDASLVVYINSKNIPSIMIINRIYETENLLSL